MNKSDNLFRLNVEAIKTISKYEGNEVTDNELCKELNISLSLFNLYMEGRETVPQDIQDRLKKSFVDLQAPAETTKVVYKRVVLCKKPPRDV